MLHWDRQLCVGGMWYHGSVFFHICCTLRYAKLATSNRWSQSPNAWGHAHVWMTIILSTYYNKHLGKNNKCHLAYKQKQRTDVTSVCQRRCAWDIPMALAAIRNTTGMHTDVNICISWCFSFSSCEWIRFIKKIFAYTYALLRD